MKPSFLKHSLILFILCVLFGCANTSFYQEPRVNDSYTASIDVNNESMLLGFVTAFIFKPNNSIVIDAIDGHYPSFSTLGRSIKLTPGVHHIAVTCSLNGRPFGSKLFIFKALPGRHYLISFPDNLKMHGYTVDFRACESLVLYS